MTGGSRTESSLPAQLGRMERARIVRDGTPRLRDEHVTLSHGSGGKSSHALIESLILPAFRNPLLDSVADAAIFSSAVGSERIALTTDSYVVSPLFFPGGDIGKLAVHGTINDLAVSGARPLALSVGLILEEGLDMAILRRVVDSMATAATAAGIPIVTGDTKVVHRGKADQLFINTSGVGVLDAGVHLAVEDVRPGDVVLVSGYVGDHGMAVMLAREALELDAAIESDSAPLHRLVTALLAAAPNTRVIKDPTRGGVASTLNEIAARTRLAIVVDEELVPVRQAVRGACEILGLDPLHIANEGKLVAIVPPEQSADALRALRGHALGADAAIVGKVLAEPEGMVLLRTGIGGSRVLDMLVGDPLPRIC
ncbi:MAG TPA: hydrogenase expression/formation protein HypE [Gemmatimonadaceae bacterium]|nr:hydrogenase expression/formation protein HypE [Gemmatimonadaceae bacterium]